MAQVSDGSAVHRSAPRADDDGARARRDARAADPLLGKVIADRYRIVSPLGKGGMGVVYKVEHLRIGKLMAMKLLTGELSRDREVVRRFKREALAASKLTSVNTVQVWDFGHSEGLTYLVMELVSGDDFGKFLKQHGPISFDRVAKIAAQVCSSLSEAHERGIVHRDLKPENLIIVETGSEDRLQDIVKVLDFGLAKLHGDFGDPRIARANANDITSAGAIVGTPFYMAPEQIRGEAVDGRADLYALGAVMYRALTGVPPFEGTSPLAVLTMHLTEPIVPPHVRAPKLGIPIEASEIVGKLMAKERDDRFSSAQDLRDALVAFLVRSGVSGGMLRSGAMQALAEATIPRDEPTMSEPPTAPHAARPATRREVDEYGRRLRRNGLIAGVMALFLLTFVLWMIEGWRHGPSTTGHAVDEESEPNDAPGDANALPLGTPVRGYLGKRPSPDVGDEDVFVIEVPAAGSAHRLLELELGGIPNLRLCLSLLEGANATPIASFCRPRGEAIHVDAFVVAPGRQYLRVSQDRSPTTPAGEHDPVYENVSDSYSLRASLVVARPGLEIEPNDTLQQAQTIAAGDTISGRLGWHDDRDVFCGEAGSQVVVVDHEGKAREQLPRPDEVTSHPLLTVALLDEKGVATPIGAIEGRFVAPRVVGARTCVAIERANGGGDGAYTVKAEPPTP